MRESFLDLLRFIAALAVVFFHFGFRGYSADGLQNLTFLELSPIARYGYIGVDLFFMISGYVIPMSVGNRAVKDFVVLRFIRLYPTFWLCMLITAVVMMAFGSEITYRDILINTSMIAPFLGGKHIDGVYWSLVVELQFYALIVGIMYFAGTDKLPRWLLVWLVLGAVVNIISKFIIRLPYIGGGYYMLFCVGAGCYFYHRQKSLVGASLIAGGLILSIIHSVDFAARVSEHYSALISPSIAVIATIFCAVLVFISPKIKVNAKIAAIGGLTYPLYLLHQNIGYAILNSFTEELRWEGLALVIALALVASYIVYRYFDLPVRGWLRSRLMNNNPSLNRQDLSEIKRS